MSLSGDEAVGVTILRRALEEPLRQLAENAGRRAPSSSPSVRRRQAEAGDKRLGYNVLTDEYANLPQKGIIDPAKVTRSALENAVSIAGMILTTEALMTDIPEPPRPAPAGGGMGGGMPEY